ncbi:MAG: sigma-70 family RNA polymerase sigma factor [Clostridia bacterium]|nr:sigma-70 family RNA polymerase sigma factor [Clostridia bacterium]
MQADKIIEGMQNKNADSLTEFRLRYAPLIHYILKPILKDERDIEECFSDITVTVWNNIQFYSPDKGTFTTWLTAISRNAAFNKARKQNRINQNEEPIYETTPSPCISPEESAIKKEQQKLLQKAIGTLSKDNQNLFYRKYYYMQSTAQIAAELGLSERAVEGRLYRIKQLLRKELGGDNDE